MKKYYDNNLLSDIKYNINNKNYEVAKEKIEEYLKIYPDDIMVKIYQMRYCNETKQFEEAYNIGFNLIGRNFRDNRIYGVFYSEFSRSLEHLGQLDEAISHLEYAVAQTNGETKTIVIALSRLYSANNELEKSVSILNKYRNYSNEPEFDLQMSDNYFKNSEYQLAIEVGSKINDSKLTAGQIQKKYYIIANSYYCLKNLDNALENFKKVLTIKNDKYYTAYYTIAQIYTAQGKYQKAASICEELAKVNRAGFSVKNLLCEIYQAINKPLGMQNVARYMTPRDNEYKLGKLCIEQFDYLGALTHFDKYLQLNGKIHKEEVLYLIILCKFKLQRYKDCLDDIYSYGINEQNKKELERMKYVCKYMLNEVDKTISYTALQMDNYTEEKAIDHIGQKHSDVDFVKYLSYKRLFEIIRNDLTKDKLDPYSPMDRYELDIKDYENYIKILDSKCNKLIVVCLPNTTNILTIFTDTQNEDDLGINEESLNNKKRTLSRAEKFKQKYASFISQN